ncbi:MAG TPA: hypothetical protein VK253_05460 [Candidatus Binatia bacterium]|nr:hypothetical protein [Candidatus Binatia bacterium]
MCQLTQLIMEKLETVKTYNAKLEVISDIAEFFSDNDTLSGEGKQSLRTTGQY